MFSYCIRPIQFQKNIQKRQIIIIVQQSVQKSKKMQENYRLSKIMTCDKHHRPLVSICIAPQCFNFRQMCADCILDDRHHAKMHLDRTQAFMKTQDDIQILFKGLKALRKKIIQTMDTKINSQHGLNQIQQKLQQIKKILNNKIDNFHTELRKIYEKNVKQKLNQLFYIVEKSYEFLEQQKIKLFKSQKLRPFFVNDLNHDLKYYQSYYEQILQKNIRKFKAGFQHDKVLKLMVSFQQNLSQIFKFQTSTIGSHHNQHILFGNGRGHFLYKFRGTSLSRYQLSFISQQSSLVGIGVIPSVYYAPKDLYYIVGDGQRQSNKIRRMNIQNSQIKDLQVRLETKRMNFAICLFNHQIFIVGGQNSKQGCVSKCQKFIPSQGKVYIVSSLNQRSAQHSLCVYKNKFILKFGGTDVMGSILQAHSQRYCALNPQIYSAQTQDWKILSFQKLGTSYIGSRINFGLWPGIFNPNGQDRIIILSGQVISKKALKSRYDITIDQGPNQIKQLKIQMSKLSMSSRNLIFSDCFAVGEEGNIYFAVMDQAKNGIFYSANIASYPGLNGYSGQKD